MQFILKDNYIYIVNNTGLANYNIEADVIIKYVEDFEHKKFKYSINGGAFKDIEKEKIVITKDELNKPYLDLVIKAFGKDSTDTFKVERIPLTYAVIFGESIENAYPDKLNKLETRLEQTHKILAEVLAYIKLQEERIQERGGLF